MGSVLPQGISNISKFWFRMSIINFFEISLIPNKLKFFLHFLSRLFLVLLLGTLWALISLCMPGLLCWHKSFNMWTERGKKDKSPETFLTCSLIEVIMLVLLVEQTKLQTTVQFIVNYDLPCLFSWASVWLDNDTLSCNKWHRWIKKHFTLHVQLQQLSLHALCLLTNCNPFLWTNIGLQQFKKNALMTGHLSRIHFLAA